MQFVSEDLLPKLVCWECGYYMSKYFDFKSRAVTSYCILTEILTKNGVITKALLESSNWNPYKSSLVQTNTLCLVVKDDEEIEEDSTVSDIKSEPECDDTVVFETANDEFDAERTDDTSALAPTNNNEEIEEDSTVSDTKIEPECDDTVVFETANDEFDAELTDDTSSLAPTPTPTNTVEETEEERTEKKKSGESANNEIIKSNNYKTTTTTAQLPRVKRKRKAASEISKDKNNSIDKSKISNVTKWVKWVGVRRKEVATVKEKKDVKSSIDGLDKDLFHITELSMDDQIAALHNRKESKNYKNSKYKCENCFKGFIDTAAYERHMTKHLETRGSHACPVCRILFKRRFSLNAHMKNHEYKISCSLCNFSTSYILAAQHHQNYHKGKTYECPHCKEVFRHKSSYLSHLRISHPSDIICKHCGCTFLNERGLQQHILWNHRDDPNQVPLDGPECARCDIRFSCQDALDTHRRVSAQHADERNAGFFESVTNSLRASLRNKINKFSAKDGDKYSTEPFPDGPKPCELCAALLATPRAYIVHFRNAHKPYLHQSRICEVCGKVFRSKEALRSHQFVHSSSKQFKCDGCGKLFQRETSLYQHQKYHCGPRVDYPCSVCGKTLSSKTNLKRHMEIHKGMSYKCEFCGKVFGCRDNKTQHVSFVHNNKPWPRRSRQLRRRAERQPETVAQSAVPETEVDMNEESNSP